MPVLDPKTTALVMIDLQHGIASMPLAPYTGEQTVQAGIALAQRFRSAGAAVAAVQVGWSSDLADMPPQNVDRRIALPEGGIPANYSELLPGVTQPGDIRITKHHWNALHDTELHLQLRRRGIKTIVLCGIATNFGVESTARHAWELGYDVVMVRDACTTFSVELHEMAVQFVFPRIARVCSAGEISFS
jgi:nicotinamidase-related amidase